MRKIFLNYCLGDEETGTNDTWMMDEYAASYYIISGHTQKRFAGSSRIWYERLKVITLPRELVVNT